MKKLSAILLLSVYLLNLAGYSLLFGYFINRTDEQLVASLDKGNYNEAALIEIKVPMQMPYGPNQLEYERWDGEIEIDGIHYNYVKRKIYNDTLYLFCIPNISKTQLDNARAEYAGSMNDIASPASGKKQADPFAKKGTFENEYDRPLHAYLFFIVDPPSKQHNNFCVPLLNCFIIYPEHPPDLSC